jgi:L-amino acid N-acyltransferase YncA
MNITIRQIELDDIAGFHAALSSVASEKKYLSTVESPPLDRIREFVRNNIEQQYSQFVAVDSDTIVGWADIVPLKRPSMNQVGSQGIGDRLLKVTIAHAWLQGLQRLELEVFAGNVPAMNLYRKHGYQVEGVKRFARLIDGVYQDTVIMGQYRI